MEDREDRFGVPAENLKAAIKRVRQQRRKYACNTHVPSRREIATLAPDAVRHVLLNWMEHSPTEIIPSRAQIALIREVLLQREDVRQLGPLLEMCRHYIDGQ